MGSQFLGVYFLTLASEYNTQGLIVAASNKNAYLDCLNHRGYIVSRNRKFERRTGHVWPAQGAGSLLCHTLSVPSVVSLLFLRLSSLKDYSR